MHFDTHRRVHLHIIPTEMWRPGPGIFSPKKVLFGSRFRDFCPTFCHLSPKNPLWKGFQHTKQIPKPGTKLVGRYRTFIFSTSGVSGNQHVHGKPYKINLPDNKTWFLVGHENTSFDKENQKQNKTHSPISLHRNSWWVYNQSLVLCRSCPQQVQQLSQLHWPCDKKALKNPVHGCYDPFWSILMDVHDLQVTHGWQSLVTPLLPHQFVAKSGTDGFQKFHDGMILVRLGRGKP